MGGVWHQFMHRDAVVRTTDECLYVCPGVSGQVRGVGSSQASGNRSSFRSATWPNKLEHVLQSMALDYYYCIRRPPFTPVVWRQRRCPVAMHVQGDKGATAQVNRVDLNAHDGHSQLVSQLWDVIRICKVTTLGHPLGIIAGGLH